MERVIVTVKKFQETRVRDLDVPAGLEAEKLAEVVSSALHWDRSPTGKAVRFKIEAYPLGRVLESSETLLSAGVRDGAWLTFIPEEEAVKKAADSAPKISAVPSAPISGWRSYCSSRSAPTKKSPVPGCS